MSTYNNIGIDSQLDWKRIAKLLRIGLFAAVPAVLLDKSVPGLLWKCARGDIRWINM